MITDKYVRLAERAVKALEGIDRSLKSIEVSLKIMSKETELRIIESNEAIADALRKEQVENARREQTKASTAVPGNNHRYSY